MKPSSHKWHHCLPRVYLRYGDTCPLWMLAHVRNRMYPTHNIAFLGAAARAGRKELLKEEDGVVDISRIES